MKAMPKTLYVKRERDGSTVYFVADEDAASLVEMGEEITIGVYTITELKTAKGVAQFD